MEVTGIPSSAGPILAPFNGQGRRQVVRLLRLQIAFLFFVPLAARAGQISGLQGKWQVYARKCDFMGTWRLNAARSSWGRKPKPSHVVVKIEHKDPVFRYSGTVVDAQGEQRAFEFDGFVDGKQHPAARECGEGRITFQWVNPQTITSEFQSNDGQCTEAGTSTLAGNGRVLKQQVRLKTREGAIAWTEVYEKQ